MVIERALATSRKTKRLIMFSLDMVAIVVSLTAAFAPRYGVYNPFLMVAENKLLLGSIVVFGAGIVNAMSLPRIKLHSIDSSAILRIGLTAVALAVFTLAVSFTLGLAAPSTVPLIFAALFFAISVSARVVALHVCVMLGQKESPRIPVAIYGAGAAGIQLASALVQSREARPVFFVDDNPNLRGLLVNGLHVYSPIGLAERIEKHGVERVLLAIPSLDPVKRSEISKRLADLSVEVMVLPSYVDIMAAGGLEDALRPVTPDELLGRDKVDLDIPEVAKAYAGRSVMVTGAGGSIGSELCRQLLNCMPAKIILYEQSEFALYAIDLELRAMIERMERPIHIVSRLGSVTDRKRVKAVVLDEQVEIILHAAAYKHVPLVEENEIEGMRNNVIGTQIVANVANEQGIERFILVSTDKAVRPTNIMGATKRMAELVVQDLQSRSQTTKFSMVRFGNVLGSSGSVLPLFESQIRAGGPVTVTHKEVTRFFMTIPEASRLVLLAGAYAEGGDLFVLDMGEPQNIFQLALRMISLSGRSVRDLETGQGDIEIKIVGLRPGEKLYEELLIDDNSIVKTPHPKIMRAQEAMLSQIEVASMLREIAVAVETEDRSKVRTLVKERVQGYHQQLDELKG